MYVCVYACMYTSLVSNLTRTLTSVLTHTRTHTLTRTHTHTHAHTDPSLIGFALSYSLVLNALFQWAVRQSAEVENQMTAVERITHYANLPTEGDRIIEGMYMFISIHPHMYLSACICLQYMRVCMYMCMLYVCMYCSVLQQSTNEFCIYSTVSLCYQCYRLQSLLV